jgi:hypothetical protein
LVRTEEEGKRQKGGAAGNIDRTNLRHSAKEKKRKKEVAVFFSLPLKRN